MEVKGIQPENLASAIMHYCKKYIPGLGRWPGGQTGTGRTVASFSMALAAVDKRVLLESVVKLLTYKKGRWKRVAKLVDSYIQEVASDVNLKPRHLRSLVESLPESSRSLHDGLYGALDIFFKAHHWLSDNEREQLGCIIDFQKLSIDACAHASQNERLPLRVILQILFFKQMQLRTALAGYIHVLDAESGPAAIVTADLERMGIPVGELEQEFGKIKEEMKKVSKSNFPIISPHKRTADTTAVIPQSSAEQARVTTSLSEHCNSFSLF